MRATALDYTHQAPSPEAPSAPPALPPGPSAPSLIQLLRSGFRPTAFIEDCARRYGDPFTVRFPASPPIVFFSHPDAIRDIFTGDPEVLRAGRANVDLLPLLGENSLLMLDGRRHLSERRLMLPPFHGERMQAYGLLMAEIADRAIDGWPVGRVFPVQPEMQAITLDVILRAVFGLEEGARLAELRARIIRLLRFVMGPAGIFLFIPWLQLDLGPLSPGGRFARYARAIDEILFAEIARRRAEGVAARTDILSMLIESRYEDGSGLSDQALRDEMITLLVAGHETTATSLAWILNRVLGRPDVLARLRAEVPADGSSEYLDAVIKETARLHPVVPNVGRQLEAPVRIGGHLLPAGVVASPCVYLTHRRPDVWPEPERFAPERFLGARPSPYEFFPFGGGVRRCIGAAFATYEMKVVLSRIVARVTLRAAPGYTARTVRRTVTFAPSDGMPVMADEIARK